MGVVKTIKRLTSLLEIMLKMNDHIPLESPRKATDFNKSCFPTVDENDCSCICYGPYCVHYNKIKNQDICRVALCCLWCIQDPNAEKHHLLCCIKDPNTCSMCNVGGGLGPIGIERYTCYPLCCSGTSNTYDSTPCLCLYSCLK